MCLLQCVKASLFPFNSSRIEFIDCILSSLAPGATLSFHCLFPSLFGQPSRLCSGEGSYHAPVAEGTH